MTDLHHIEIRLTPEFQRKFKNLFKKYRQISTDLQPILEQLKLGEFLGDQISGIAYTVMKVRIKNSDIQKGKSGVYRLIYWIPSTELVILLDIYAKSDQEDIEVDAIRQIINKSSTTFEESDA